MIPCMSLLEFDSDCIVTEKAKNFFKLWTAKTKSLELVHIFL
jgi:hypothetical protein